MPIAHRPRLAGAGAIAAIAVLVVAAPVSAEQHRVSMVDDAFAPASITVRVGDTVRWTNDGQKPHTVTSLSGPAFDSGIVSPGGAYSRSFASAGTFQYHCFLHDGMVGRVVVRAAPANPTPRPQPTRRPSGGGGGGGGGGEQPDTATLVAAGETGTGGSGGSNDGLVLVIGLGALGALVVGRRRLLTARDRRASRPWA